MFEDENQPQPFLASHLVTSSLCGKPSTNGTYENDEGDEGSDR